MFPHSANNHAEHAPQQQPNHERGEYTAHALGLHGFIRQAGLGDDFHEELLLLGGDACLLQCGERGSKFLLGKGLGEHQLFVGRGLAGQGVAAACDLGTLPGDFLLEGLDALAQQGHLRVVGCAGDELRKLRLLGDEFVLQLGDELQLQRAFGRGVEHAPPVAVGRNGQRGGAHLGFGLGHVLLVKTHGVFVGLGVEAVDEALAECQQVGIDVLGILRGVGGDAQGADVGDGVDVVGHHFFVVVEQFFKAGVRSEHTAKAVEHIDAAVAHHVPVVQGALQFGQGVAREDVVVHGVRAGTGMRQPGGCEQ